MTGFVRRTFGAGARVRGAGARHAQGRAPEMATETGINVR